MNERSFIDTNIIVYAYDEAYPVKQRRSQELIFEGLRKENGVISAQVLSEFYVTVTRKIAEPLSRPVAEHLLSLLSFLDVVDIDPDIVKRAVRFEEDEQLSYWDGMILSAAERAGCSILYSEDFSHERIYEGITVFNPFAGRSFSGKR